MSVLGLVCLTFVWSAALWVLASALSSLNPSPKAAQAIWRGAAALMFAPFVASAFMPGVGQVAVQALPDLPMVEALTIQPAAEFQDVTRPAFRMPHVSTLVVWVLVAGWCARGGPSGCF